MGWGVSVTPWPLFTSGKDPVPTVQEAGWAPEPVWTGAENLAPTEIRSPDRPARSQSLYRLRYPDHGYFQCLKRNTVCFLNYTNSGFTLNFQFQTVISQRAALAPMPTADTFRLLFDLCSSKMYCFVHFSFNNHFLVLLLSATNYI